MFKAYKIHRPNGEIREITTEGSPNDINEKNRIRIKGFQMESLIEFQTGLTLLQSAISEKGFKELLKNLHLNKRVYCFGVPHIQKVVDILYDNIKSEQMASVVANLEGCSVTISQKNARPPQFTALPQSTINALTTGCQEGMCKRCLLTGKESKKCVIRKAFDTVPGKREYAGENNTLGLDICPYLMNEEMDF